MSKHFGATQKCNSCFEARKLTKGEKQMAHKFAYRWSVFTVNYSTSPPQFVDRGYMDLTTMDDYGVLANGNYHEVPTNVDHPIMGTANQIGASLVLAHPDRRFRFEGMLVRDKDGNMTIAGRRLTRVTPLKGRETLLNQEEEPWIITKP
jgi:hypothetical protein